VEAQGPADATIDFVSPRRHAPRQAWFEQLALEMDYDHAAPRFDRFQGVWQDGGERVGFYGYSPPALTLDEVRSWCEDRGVERCYVDALSGEPDPMSADERFVLIGRDPGFPDLDAVALIGRSARWSQLPKPSWIVHVRANLPVTTYGEAKSEVAAALATVPACAHVDFDDAAALIGVQFALQAPTPHVAGTIANQLLRCTLTGTPDGRFDEASNGFGTSLRSVDETTGQPGC